MVFETNKLESALIMLIVGKKHPKFVQYTYIYSSRVSVFEERQTEGQTRQIFMPRIFGVIKKNPKHISKNFRKTREDLLILQKLQVNNKC